MDLLGSLLRGGGHDSTAAVLHGVEDLRLEARPVGAPGTGQALIRVHSVGICGSDLHYFSHAQIKGQKMSLPTSEGFQGVMGHEASGVVEAVGEGVTTLKAGDRVALEAGVPCSRCRTCREGRYNLCREVRFLGSFLSKCPGALAQRLLHPASFCHALPDAVSLEEAALLEPLNVALAAVRRAAVAPGHRVLVTGAGAVGLLTALAARAAGAAHVTVTDMQAGRLALATSLGVTEAAHAGKVDVVAQVRAGEREPYDSCIECSGADPCIAVCIRAAKSGGKCVLVGIGANMDATLPLAEATGREVDLLGVFRYCNLYPAAIALVASGAVDVKPLISHHFELADVAQAFRTALSGSDAVKVLIHPNGVPTGAHAAAAARGVKRPRLEPGFANGARACACCGGEGPCGNPDKTEA